MNDRHRFGELREHQTGKIPKNKKINTSRSSYSKFRKSKTAGGWKRLEFQGTSCQKPCKQEENRPKYLLFEGKKQPPEIILPK